MNFSKPDNKAQRPGVSHDASFGGSVGRGRRGRGQAGKGCDVDDRVPLGHVLEGQLDSVHHAEQVRLHHV